MTLATNANPLIVALYGGPGTGKSTTASLVFGALKQRGHNVELVHEVAKDLTWEGRTVALSHQPYIIAKQMFKYDRLYGQVDAIITDTSTLLASIYMGYGAERLTAASAAFLDWVEADWLERRTLNVFLQRDPNRQYNPAGRSQSEEEALMLDRQILHLLNRLQLPLMTTPVDKDNDTHVLEIVQEIERCLRH